MRLVIDTDVTSAASESDDETSIACRRFLEVVRELEYQFVISPELWEEWKVHRSRFSNRWLTAMYAKKLVERTGIIRNDVLRNRIAQQAKNETVRSDMLKDVHLLEAALVTDLRIASRNTAQRNQFASLSHVITEIKVILWTDPVKSGEMCLGWLQRNAPLDQMMTLEFVEIDK